MNVNTKVKPRKCAYCKNMADDSMLKNDEGKLYCWDCWKGKKHIEELNFSEIIPVLSNWVEENFTIKAKKKTFTKYMGRDFGMAGDMNISDTFNNKGTLKYYLEDADGPDCKGYTIPKIIIMKLIQFGIVYGQQIAEKGNYGIGIKKKWNINTKEYTISQAKHKKLLKLYCPK